MAKNTWVKSNRYMERSVMCQTNGIWEVEVYNQMNWNGLQLSVRFACESEHAPLSGRSMWGSADDGKLTAGEDMYLVPAYVQAQARKMIREVANS